MCCLHGVTSSQDKCTFTKLLGGNLFICIVFRASFMLVYPVALKYKMLYYVNVCRYKTLRPKHTTNKIECTILLFYVNFNFKKNCSFDIF